MCRCNYNRNGRPNIPPYRVPRVQYSPQYPFYVPYRKLPPVDTKLFIKSSNCIQTLLVSANILVKKFIDSPEFSNNIMSAAHIFQI